jgi:hypothetical protein
MSAIHTVRYATAFAALLLAGCSHPTPKATVEVIDTSLSITPRAEKAALDAVGNQIARMERGDVLVLIPITGDAANDAGGRILRLAEPTTRETYDADLKRFQADAQEQFAAWTTSLDRHQSRTDILGALDAARQELASLPSGINRRLIVVSDFLEDDDTYNFVSDRSFANPLRARQLAVRLRQLRGLSLEGVPVCLGRLESSDFAMLSAQRKAAVNVFWEVYFAGSGGPTELHFDGTGMLANLEHGCGSGKR